MTRDPAHEAAFAHWAAGYGVIHHGEAAQARIRALAADAPDPAALYRLLAALDRLSAMGCWLVGQMTYARHIHLDGRVLGENDFKLDPQGHTGGSLNMVPAYAAYMAANAWSGLTRGWVMGQGHCVAAIDAVNVILGNLGPLHATRYPWDDAGLTQLTKDFYDYRVEADGHPRSPLGSHVNAHTAGGILEGGYLGFADLQYVHMPLPGERLVAFLSDGAFEEQRGADWAARWWRAEDCGLVVPVMIANGRRIDQRSTIMQMGGVDWLGRHLRNNGFDPFVIDGTDPAEFFWALLEAERRLADAAAAARSGGYPVALPYVIAAAPKGFGFPNAGTNLAHGTPLAQNPAGSAGARADFNAAAARLFVPAAELAAACAQLNNHDRQGRPRERDNPLANRQPPAPALPEPVWENPGAVLSPMQAIDRWSCALFTANPGLRPRVGNPDEMRSNHMGGTLALLRHRVTSVEAGNDEAIDGAVISALNEEAVVCSALANKGGLNLVVSYEAFAVKMLGALRQEIIFARHLREAGRPAAWIAVPVLATSHTWENGKNEQSHQDPTLCEVLMGEMNDISRVLFPADANSAVAALRAVYGERGRIATLVVAKQALPVALDGRQAEALARDGAIPVRETACSVIELLAVGAYQLQQADLAWKRLGEHGLAARLVYVQEPGRFRAARDHHEAASLADAATRARLFGPAGTRRIVISHTRPEVMAGVLRPLDGGAGLCTFLGYRNQGGTLDTGGMLYANGCTWGHIVAAAAGLLGRDPATLLTAEEWRAVRGEGDPYALIPRPHAAP